MRPNKIIIHHSLTEDDKTVSWDAIRKYHTVTNGWSDIGYHYGIELVGARYEILKGRMDNEVGAHCIGFNDDSIGICMVGNFDQQGPSQEQQDVALKLCRSLMAIYSITPQSVLGHWETYALRDQPVQKSCPGNRFSMPEFRRKL